MQLRKFTGHFPPIIGGAAIGTAAVAPNYWVVLPGVAYVTPAQLVVNYRASIGAGINVALT
jgi:hypothetical protein